MVGPNWHVVCVRNNNHIQIFGGKFEKKKKTDKNGHLNKNLNILVQGEQTITFT